ncbi:MAG: MBL fold metallo-hydrolase [Clostridia bacterium]|nr:MBL fold metallo-hydrolase [Clostridia bacterium]
MTELKMCSLRSSSKGNSTVIYSENTKILVDCGISGKTLESSLAEINIQPSSLDAVLITHEHTDHTKGVGVVARKFNIPVFATYGTWSQMSKSVGEIPDGCRRVFDETLSFQIGDITVQPFEIPHDAAHPVGYVFFSGDDKVAVATDIGVMKEEIFEMLKGSRIVLLESNYDLFMLEAGTYPYELKRRIKSDLGHLCNDDAALAARDLVQSGTKTVILGHISQENNYPELVYQTTKLCLMSHGIKVGKDVMLLVAKRDGIVEAS